ncbi:furin-like protease kpc-1 [Mya arenaria]|uniref:furin-like protease kpc-1 n=1 Tax=Mya arenaria TaxID=6604 RepID=UPI0022E27CAA|nr:furin-like protease kpc-1 [Mya arenaria]
MYVYESWDKGYTGNDVTIAIVDDGVDTSHSDLSYDASLSYDYAYDVMDSANVDASDGHGTNCAGVAAALKNSVCVIGVAYNANIAAVRLLDSYIGATSSMKALAITHKLDYVDIYSNSWGPSDDGENISPLSNVLEEALKTGVTDGRSGKGAIYVWASGNGGEDEDDCNADGYASSIYTIGINAVSQTGAPTYYAEWCTSAMAGTYSGDDPNPDIEEGNKVTSRNIM